MQTQDFLYVVSSLASPPDIIILTETWQIPDDRDFCSIDGHSCHHTVQAGGREGGVSVFCAAELRADRYLTFVLAMM